MSQNNESDSDGIEVQYQSGSSQSPLAKPDVISSGVNTETNDVPQREENDSSDRDTDSGLQVNSQDLSASGGDESPQPNAEETSLSSASISGQASNGSNRSGQGEEIGDDVPDSNQAEKSCPEQNDGQSKAQGNKQELFCCQKFQVL